MPTYVFQNTETGEEFEKFMGISEADTYLEENPHIKRMVQAPQIISKSGDRTNMGGKGGFNEVLHKVADKHPQSALAKQVKTRTASEVKRDQVIKKHGLDKLK
tara:strand:+ start:541 stop:849 length:309 start_codon:yes stop_codon:yes gene_type:complete